MADTINRVTVVNLVQRCIDTIDLIIAKAFSVLPLQILVRTSCFVTDHSSAEVLCFDEAALMAQIAGTGQSFPISPLAVSSVAVLSHLKHPSSSSDANLRTGKGNFSLRKSAGQEAQPRQNVAGHLASEGHPSDIE